VQVFGEDPTGEDPDPWDVMKMFEELGTSDPAEDLCGDGQVDSCSLQVILQSLNSATAQGGAP